MIQSGSQSTVETKKPKKIFKIALNIIVKIFASRCKLLITALTDDACEKGHRMKEQYNMA